MANVQDRRMIQMFSVLMPVYAKENPNNLKEALYSVVNQTLLPDEIVLVKDGPLTEELDKVISEFYNSYSSLLKVFELKENKGSGAARKHAVENCTNEIIAIMDSDDIARSDRFEKQIKFLKENPDIDAVGSYLSEFEGLSENIYAVRRVPLTHDEIYKYAKWRNPINQQTLMTKKTNILKAGNYSDDYKLMQDYHLWVKMLITGTKFANIPECLVNMRAGRTMIKRRGLRAFKYEIKFFTELYSLKFITGKELCKNLFCKFWLRIIPSNLRVFVYNQFLRRDSLETDSCYGVSI